MNMKKTYISPMLLQVEVAPHLLISDSIEKFETGGGDVLVKEDFLDFGSSDNDSYNAWDDDWRNDD